jgi:hypothetical protein
MLGHQADRLAVNDAKKAVGNSQRLQASKKKKKKIIEPKSDMI